MADENKSSDPEQIIKFVIVQSDGRIRQSGALQRQDLGKFATIYPDCQAMEVAADQFRLDIDAHFYVLDGVITLRGIALDATEYTIRADGLDKVSFTVPAGTSVMHGNEIVVIEDGVFEFTTDALGDYRFPFIAPAAFRHFEVTIHAV